MSAPLGSSDSLLGKLTPLINEILTIIVFRDSGQTLFTLTLLEAERAFSLVFFVVSEVYPSERINLLLVM